MKIRLAIVAPELLPQVRERVAELRSAVNAGDMDGVDTVTAELLALTADCRSVDLTEEEWRRFLADVRSGNPTFESDYLLPSGVCAAILPAITTSDSVLELPIDGEGEKEHTNV